MRKHARYMSLCPPCFHRKTLKIPMENSITAALSHPESYHITEVTTACLILQLEFFFTCICFKTWWMKHLWWTKNSISTKQHYQVKYLLLQAHSEGCLHWSSRTHDVQLRSRRQGHSCCHQRSPRTNVTHFSVTSICESNKIRSVTTLLITWLVSVILTPWIWH